MILGGHPDYRMEPVFWEYVKCPLCLYTYGHVYLLGQEEYLRGLKCKSSTCSHSWGVSVSPTEKVRLEGLRQKAIKCRVGRYPAKLGELLGVPPKKLQTQR